MNADDQLGPYKILEPLGAGGMGEVYLGEDTRLGRKVAIKVLPAEFAADPERLARFEQEARAAAALNHPHIAVVHDIGFEEGPAAAATEGNTDPNMAASTVPVGGVHYIVQEYLEGEALDTRLSQGALPIKKATSLAAAVAEALAAAHEAGIVHRDLKPANIFVTQQGHAKVLDFGLAKLTEPATGGVDASMSPTMLGTMAGQVMGTAGYMSPEQVEGRPVDRRADIFAFGCVLYEAVTGAKAFAGQSVPDTLAKILHEEPTDLTQATGTMPAELARIARKCLAKEPESRYQHADDLVVDLRAAADQNTGPVGVPSPAADAAAPGVAAAQVGGPGGAPSSRVGGILPWALAAIAIVIAIAAWVLRPEGSADAGIVRFSITRGQPELVNFQSPPFAVSPDGRTIVYLAATEAGEQLFIRRVDELDATPIPESPSGRAPFFSPDGTEIGFFADGELRRVALAGGRPVSICAVASTNGSAVWTEDDEIIFGLEAASAGLYRVPARGGEPVPLTTLDTDRGERQHASPQLLPGGDRILFAASRQGAGGLQVVALDTGAVTVEGPPLGLFHALTGNLLFVDEQQLFAQPFDVEQPRLTGTRIALLDSVARWHLSAAGTLAYTGAGDQASGTTLVRMVDRRGRVVGELSGLPPGDYMHPALSPDGKWLALTEDSLDPIFAPTIGVYELDRDAFTSRAVSGYGAQWRADSRTFAFGAPANSTLVWKELESAGEPRELVSATAGSVWTTDISADGRLLAYYEVHPDTGRDIWTVVLDGDDAPQPFLVTAASERSAVFSPDGEWIAYMSDASGSEEVYVRPFPAGGPEVQVSIGGGREPRWSVDGTEMFYRSGRGMYALPVVTQPQFVPGTPELLFEGRFAVQAGGRNANYDVDADGNFYVVQVPEGGERINVVLNWDRELERLLAGGR